MAVRSPNTFVGTVARLLVTPLLTEVGVAVESLGEVVALITSESFERLKLTEGEIVTALVKPTEFFIARQGKPGFQRSHNCLSGRIVTVDLGGGTVEVQGELDDGSAVCVVAAAAIQEHDPLVPGDQVWFYFKAMSLIISAEGRLPAPAFGEAGDAYSRP